MSVSKYPDVMIVGAQKSGTTSVFDALSNHREIHAPKAAKDFTGYFVNDELYAQGDWWYQRQFHPASQHRRVVAANVNYLYSKTITDRIFSYNPDMLIVICLRCPIARLRSAWAYATQRGIETRSIRESLKTELSRIARVGYDVEDPQRDYIRHSLYHSHVARYINVFSRSQVHLIFFEKLLSDPVEQMGSLQEFLGLELDDTVELPHSNKTAGRPRSLWLSRLLSRDSRLRLIWRRYGFPIPMPWKYALLQRLGEINTNRAKSVRSEPVRDKHVLALLAQDIDQLEATLGQHVPDSWRKL